MLTHVSCIVVDDKAVGLWFGAQKAAVHTQVLGQFIQQTLVRGLRKAAFLVQQGQQTKGALGHNQEHKQYVIMGWPGILGQTLTHF